MKELVRHIESLLLEHDCVVVPQIGGFVTSDVPAKYIEEENIFLPPMRTIGFNEHLMADDGLLIRSYINTYRCSEVDARRMLGLQIRELQQELWENNIYELGNIGVLSMNERNEIHFSPCQGGALSPNYFGFDAIVLEQRNKTVPVEHQVETKKDRIISSDSSNEITIRLKKSWIQNFVVAAASILIFFALSPHVHNTSNDKVRTAEFALMMMPDLENAMSSMSLTDDNSIDTLQQTTIERMQSDEVAAPQPEMNVAEKTLSGYCVVVASAIPEKNAIAYVEHLTKSGYDGAQIYKSGGMTRVVFGGYETESAAMEKVQQLKDSSQEFINAWIYRIK